MFTKPFSTRNFGKPHQHRLYYSRIHNKPVLSTCKTCNEVLEVLCLTQIFNLEALDTCTCQHFPQDVPLCFRNLHMRQLTFMCLMNLYSGGFCIFECCFQRFHYSEYFPPLQSTDSPKPFII